LKDKKIQIDGDFFKPLENEKDVKKKYLLVNENIERLFKLVIKII